MTEVSSPTIFALIKADQEERRYKRNREILLGICMVIGILFALLARC